MPLNFLNEGGGAAFIRFSVEDNAWQRSSEGGDLVEVETPFGVMIDIENVKLGWLKLQGGRDWVAMPNNDPTKTPKPSDQHKQGFSVEMYSSKVFGDEHVREFCASGTGVQMFIKKLHDEAEASGNFGKGQIPVVKIEKSKDTMKIGAGRTRIPPFEIIEWKDRPSEFTAQPVAVKSSDTHDDTSTTKQKENEDFSV